MESPALIDRPAQIVNFTVDCWRALPSHDSLALSRRDEKLDAAILKLTDWLERRPARQATRRELQRAHVAGVRTAAELDALLDRYVEIFPGSVLEASQARGGIATKIVKAPPRGKVSLGVATGDTEGDSAENARGYGGFGGVAAGDISRGDTGFGDTAEPSSNDNGTPAGGWTDDQLQGLTDESRSPYRATNDEGEEMAF